MNARLLFLFLLVLIYCSYTQLDAQSNALTVEQYEMVKLDDDHWNFISKNKNLVDQSDVVTVWHLEKGI